MQTKVQANKIFITFLIGSFFAILNETLLNIALTKLMDVFQVDATMVQWLVTGFMLVMGILMPVSAIFIQWFTTRQLFIGVMTVFLVGTVIAACAVNFSMLLIGRMIQGVGTGLLMPVIMNALLLIYPPEVRGKIMGIFGFVIMFAPAIGPTLSGVIVDLLGWRWLFIAVIPFAIFSILFALKYLQNVGELTRPKVDGLSVVLSTVGIGGIVFGVSGSGEASGGDSSPIMITIIIISLLSIVLFVWRQLKLKEPLLDVRVFQYRNFAAGVTLFVIVIIAMFATEIILPMYLQGPVGYSAKVAGLLLLPGALLNGLTAPVMGTLFDKYGPRKLIIPGMIMLVGTILFFTRLHPSVPIWLFMAVYILLMLAISAIMMPAETNGLNELPQRLYPHGTAIVSTLQPVAGALGVSIFVGIMTFGRESYIKEQTGPITQQVMNEAMTVGIHYAYWFALVISLIALVISFFIKRAVSPDYGAK